jgi:O-antigen/teichoic acid export membrane protein
VTGAEERLAEETHLATRNALKLGSSLLFTGLIAIAMRLWLPRYLGPERFGVLSFADALTGTFFVALSLGADIYVRKHVSVRPEHASDFFGGTLMLRALAAAVILGAMAVTMEWTGRPPEVRLVVYLFAFFQFFVNANATLSALLHAKGTVGGVSVLAVVSKLVWAAGTLFVIVTGGGIWGFALAYLASEALKSVALYYLARRHLGLVFRVDVRATRAMVISSLPYYLNTVATTAYGKLGLTLLGFFSASVVEVGYYAVALAIAGLTLLATPLIEWVLMPMFARAAARSEEELFARIRGATEFIFAVAVPASLLISLSASSCIDFVFGAGFAPAALALGILAPTFVVTYVAIVYAITLLMLDRAWTLTIISLAGLAVNLLLNVTLIRPSLAFFGEGGGGAGAALAALGTEVFVTSAMVAVVGKRAFDRRGLTMIGKSLGVCVVVVIVDRLALGLGPARLLLDAALYVVLALSVGAVPTDQVVSVLKSVFDRRRRVSVAAEPTPATTSGEGR